MTDFVEIKREIYVDATPRQVGAFCNGWLSASAFECHPEGIGTRLSGIGDVGRGLLAIEVEEQLVELLCSVRDHFAHDDTCRS